MPKKSKTNKITELLKWIDKQEFCAWVSDPDPESMEDIEECFDNGVSKEDLKYKIRELFGERPRNHQ